jgi:hypothetical protein
MNLKASHHTMSIFCQVRVTHAYNLSYSRNRLGESQLEDRLGLYLEEILHKKGLVEWLKV